MLWPVSKALKDDSVGSNSRKAMISKWYFETNVNLMAYFAYSYFLHLVGNDLAFALKGEGPPSEFLS